VAEDDGATRAMFQAALETSGYTVLAVADGQQAVDQLEAFAPDLVLLDMMMPRLDGCGACKKIHATPGFKQTPVIMVTGLDDSDAIESAYQAGATDFVNKPIKWANLRYRIRYLLRQKQMGDRLRTSETRLANAQRIARLGSWDWQVGVDALRWSDEVYAILGIRPFDFGGHRQDFIDLLHPDERDRVNTILDAALKSGQTLRIDFRVGLGRHEKSIHLEGEIVRDESGRATTVSGTIQDISEQQQARRKIRHMSRYDALTDLPNRTLFNELFSADLSRAQQAQHQAGVMFVGLDRFKRVNDTLGHDTGDAVLKEAAARLTRCLTRWSAEVRPPEDHRALISRFGGDEFTISLPWITHPKQAQNAANIILASMAKPYRLKNQEIYLTTSIGVALSPDDGNTLSGLLTNADAALRHAKAKGKNNAQFYTQSLNADAQRRLSIENKLQTAIKNNELSVHYQPKVDMLEGRLIGMEALVRWNHPELGTVSPAEFIPIAEESGIISAIGAWVLKEACSQTRAWQKQGLPKVMISVNLSARQFWQKDLAEQVAQILVESNLSPRYLELEITEGTFMHNAEETIKTLGELKNLGIKLSVDDFGTGYSSLAYLQQFPVDTLKVDRSFVTDVTDNADSAAITRTIIFMAHSLGLSVIAEGVETPEQYAFLREHGCNQMQGYLFSPPVDAERFGQLLAEGCRMDVDALLTPPRP